MKKVLVLAIAAALALCAAPVEAQTTPICGVDHGAFGMVVGGVDTSHCYYVTPNADGSINVVPISGGSTEPPYVPTKLTGTQRGVSMATATALTVPATATMVLISVEGTNNSSGVCAYWQDDGTNPTASAGQPLAANAYLPYNASGLPIKLIAATGATCTFNASYYK